MAASSCMMNLLQSARMPLNARVLETRASCIHNFITYTPVHAPTHNRRCKSTKVPEDKVLPPIKVKRFFYNKVVSFITSSVDKLEKRMPKTYQVYNTFRTGVSMFVTDTKRYYGITTRLWGGESLSHLTRRELELYRQFSSDLPVVATVMIIAFAPGGVFVFPLAYMFPRYLLSPHFWTKKQRKDFRQLEMSKRLTHYPSVLDLMHQSSESSKRELQIKKAVNKLETSVNLSTKEILALKPLFEEKPFNLDAIPFNYRWHLSRSMGFSLRRKKLVKEALLVHFMDLALIREGIHNLTDDDLNRTCQWRGLNPEDMDREAKLAYVKKWTEITADIHEPSITLLLHLPILMAYTQPSNRKLMGSRDTSFRGKI